MEWGLWRVQILRLVAGFGWEHPPCFFWGDVMWIIQMIGVLICFGSVKGCKSRFFRVPLTTQGATLYMVCRSKERAEAARDEIVAAAAGHRSGGRIYPGDWCFGVHKLRLSWYTKRPQVFTTAIFRMLWGSVWNCWPLETLWFTAGWCNLRRLQEIRLAVCMCSWQIVAWRCGKKRHGNNKNPRWMMAWKWINPL